MYMTIRLVIVIHADVDKKQKPDYGGRGLCKIYQVSYSYQAFFAQDTSSMSEPCSKIQKRKRLFVY